jgi:CDP-glucose 4,6-dehydratase
MGRRFAALESLVSTHDFWSGKRVLVTGHTGFKGSWLALWLHALGAKVMGYALEPHSQPSLWRQLTLSSLIPARIADIRDLARLRDAFTEFQPEVVFHLAAQALVRTSYEDPIVTYSTNVMGTANVLEAVRGVSGVRAVINVTSDKCYENREWNRGYREDDAMGGYDPYSSSKGCAELITAAFRKSFFNPGNYCDHGVALASARAGNVIGGGDWAHDRLVPDVMRAMLSGKRARIRHPNAVRPWQHVLDPLRGYLLLAERLWTDGPEFSGGWNFGPAEEDSTSVGIVVDELVSGWGNGAGWVADPGPHPHEAHYLRLDCSKARSLLDWEPKLAITDALAWTVDWYRGYGRNADVEAICLQQINRFEELGGS